MKSNVSRIFALLMICLITCLILASCGHEHSFGEWKTKKEATCEKEGRMVRTCECGEEETKIQKKAKHVFGDWETDKAATCEEDGTMVRLCKCGEKKTKSVEMLGHTFGEWETTTEPACEIDGQLTRVCQCGKSETKKVKMTGHEYKDEVTTAAGCNQNGVITYTCENCNDSYTEEFSATVYTPTEVYNMYLGSVGEVTVYDRNGYEMALGSCFVYESDKIITNYHVIEGAHSAIVTFGEDVYDIETVLAYDTTIDVAVLKVANADLAPGTLCEKDHSVGETVYAFGSSQGLTATFSDGMITTSNREIDGVHHVQHDAPISSGNSGGPLINIYGEIVGINTWTLLDSQNLNFAIHISELKNLDFSTPLTLSEVCELESDAFSDIVEYVITYGDYDHTDGSYFMTVGYDYTEDGYLLCRSVMYYEGDDYLYFIIDIDDENLVAITVNSQLDGNYSWFYIDNDYYMEGDIIASSFKDGNMLSYTYDEIGDANVRSAIRELVSYMASALLYSITADYADLGITAVDFGFVHFS